MKAKANTSTQAATSAFWILDCRFWTRRAGAGST
jgi:hypothetical protein